MSRLAIATAVAALSLALAGSASAATTWYVDGGGNGSACTQANPCPVIATAVGKAVNGDAIRIGAGTYNESITTAKRLTFDGAGAKLFDPTSTIILGDTTGPALELSNGGAVRDLVVLGADGPSQAPFLTGILLDPQGSGQAVPYTLSNVVGSHGHASGVGEAGPALDVHGTTRPLILHAHDVSLAGHGNLATPLQVLGSHTTATFDGLKVNGGGDIGGIYLENAAVTIGRAVTNNVYAALTVGSGSVTINRSDILSDKSGVAISSHGGTLTVRDSLIHAEPSVSGNKGIELQAFHGSRTVNLIGSTVVARGIGPTALSIQSDTGEDSTVHAVNTAIHSIPTGGGSPADITADRIGGQLVFTASHSYYGKASATGVTLPPPGSGTNLGGDPGFVDAAGGKYALAPGSPLVDRGDPLAAKAGEPDFLGAPRSRDGNGDCFKLPDIGAFERPGLTCPPLELTGVRFKPHKLRAGHGGKLSLRLSRKARLTVLVQRRKHGKFRRVAKIAKVVGPGPVKLKIGPKVKGKTLRRGRYRIKLSAIDVTRHRSKTRTVKFKVVR
jgi:hypothetical protein